MMMKSKGLICLATGIMLFSQLSLTDITNAATVPPRITSAALTPGYNTRSDVKALSVTVSGDTGDFDIYYVVVPSDIYPYGYMPESASIVAATVPEKVTDGHVQARSGNVWNGVDIGNLPVDGTYTAYLVAVKPDDPTNYSEPVAVRGLVRPTSHKFTEIAANDGYTLGVNEDGTVTYLGREAKLKPPAGLSGVQSVTAGKEHAIALKLDGTVTGWGNNTKGQLDIPSELLDPETAHVKALAAGDYHTLALRTDGTVVAWGENNYNQATVPADLANVAMVDAGTDFSMALKEDGSIVEFGRPAGTDSMAGNRAENTGPTPDVQYKEIAAGYDHRVAVRIDGTVDEWGRGRYQQTVDIPEGLTDVIEVDAAWDYTVALKDDGTVVTWGNTEWTSGVGSPNPGDLPEATKVAAGKYHTVILEEDEDYYAWGHNVNFAVTGPSNNAYLKSIYVGFDRIPLTPAFSPNITDYSVTVPANSASIWIEATLDTADEGRGYAVLYLGDQRLGSGFYLPQVQLQYGPNPVKLVVPANDGTTKTYNVTITREGTGPGTGTGGGTQPDPGTNPGTPTYTMAPIADQILLPLTQGYTPGTQEVKTISVNNTGTGNLANLTATISGGNAGDFELTSPASTVNSSQSTSFTVKAKDGLPAGTYEATVTLSADQTANVTFKVKQVVTAPGALVSPHLTGTGGDRHALLNWTSVTEATYYDLFMSTTPGEFSNEPVETVTDVTYNMQHLTNGTTYYFVVKAGNALGSSGPSNQVDVTPRGRENEGGGSPVSPGSPATGTPQTPSVRPTVPEQPGTSEPEKSGEVQDPNDIFRSRVVQADSNVISGVENKVAEILRNGDKSDTLKYDDVAQHWAFPSIEKLTKLGVINGYPDGGFDPDEQVTRAEFAAMIYRGFIDMAGRSVDVQPGDYSKFNDLKGHWSSEYLMKLVNVGVMSGYGDGTIRPEQTISRQEMALMITRVLNEQILNRDTSQVKFTDLDQAYGAEAIKKATALGIFIGKTDQTFDPNAGATRAESIQTIINTYTLSPAIKAALESLQ